MAEVSPSSDCEEYPSPTDGTGPFMAGGTRSGYDQVKSPVEPPADQVADGVSEVAV